MDAELYTIPANLHGRKKRLLLAWDRSVKAWGQGTHTTEEILYELNLLHIGHLRLPWQVAEGL